MSNILSKDFTAYTLFKFTLPTIIMMVFMSLYTMIDGIFVSRFIGTAALSSVNIVYPIINIIIAIAIMLASGMSAVIGKKMGEDKITQARENFSLVIVVGIIIGLIIAVVGIIFISPIIKMLGANESVYDMCVIYAKALLIGTPLAILQMLFQYFFVTAGKPNIGLIATIIGGVANIILDYVFIVPMKMGIVGAALATVIGFSIPAFIGLFYFFINKKGSLYFVCPKWDLKAILDSLYNGSSEMVTNLSIAITTFLFNIVMIKLLGENGVAAITIILYAQYFLTAVYLGYSSGVAPILSYNFGNENIVMLKKILRMSLVFLIYSSIIVFASAIFMSDMIIQVFAQKGSEVFAIAQKGFVLFSISYIFTGTNIFSSAMFTALSNGKISAIISFLRSFVFIVLCIVILPKFLGVTGVWIAVPIAEFLTFICSIVFVYKYVVLKYKNHIPIDNSTI